MDFTAIFTAIIAFATALAALAACQSARETKKIVLAHIVMQIRDEFKSKKIPDDIKELLALGSNNWERFASELESIDILERADQIKFYNWIVDYHQIFYKLMTLYKSKIITKNLIINIVSEDEISMLFKVIEPIERNIVLIGENSVFETFRWLFKIKTARHRGCSR